MLASELIAELQDWLSHYRDAPVKLELLGSFLDEIRSVSWTYEQDSDESYFALSPTSFEEDCIADGVTPKGSETPAPETKAPSATHPDTPRSDRPLNE